MSTVQPPPPSLPPAPVSGLVNATAVVVKAPPALQTLALGQAVQATVTAQPAATAPTVANPIQVLTQLGPITLQTALVVPKDAVLTLVLTSLTPQAFQIGLVDGKPIPGALTPAQAKAAGLPSVSVPPSTGAAPALQAGTQVGAVLLRPALAAPQSTPQATPAAISTVQAQAGATPAQAQAQPGPAAQAQPGAPAPATLASAPAATPAPTAQAAKGAAPTPQTSQAAPPAQSSATVSASASPPTSAASVPAKAATPATVTLPSGTRFSVAIQRIEAPNAALTTPTPAAGKGLAQGQILTGTVIGRTPLGQSIVQTPGATMALESRALLADGAKVTFKLDSAPLLPAPSTAAQRLGRAGLGLGLINAKTWDDLGEALKTLAAVDPARFQHVAHTALPQPGSKLTNQLLFFLNALKGGDIKTVFGDTATRLIDKQRPGLMSRLGGDFQVMSRMADEPQSGDWRLALIPLWSGEQLEQVRLYYRGGNDEEETASPDDARFVLDLELSNLGHMQIDGLMKPAQKNLDLIIRTEQPLPTDMRADIAEIAMAAEDLFGLATIVSFQAKPADFVEFPPDAPPEAGLIA